MTRRIVQFGTSRFLQAHVDLFVHEARAAGQDIGPITVVKTTSGAANVPAALRPSGGRAASRCASRAITTNEIVDETIQVMSVDSALDADSDWLRLTDLFAGKAEYRCVECRRSRLRDRRRRSTDRRLSGAPRSSFPAKLLQLLIARYEAGGRPLRCFPCELVPANGTVLRRRSSRVSPPLEDGRGLRPMAEGVRSSSPTRWSTASSRRPSSRSARWPSPMRCGRYTATGRLSDTPPLSSRRTSKRSSVSSLHILNLGHTWLAETWMKDRRPERETVKEILADPAVRARLDALYAKKWFRVSRRAAWRARRGAT